MARKEKDSGVAMLNEKTLSVSTQEMISKCIEGVKNGTYTNAKAAMKELGLEKHQRTIYKELNTLRGKYTLIIE